MPRIAGTNIPENKKVEFALPYIYGIGLTLSRKILASAGIPVDRLAKELIPSEINRIQTLIEKNYLVEGNLRREITNSIKRLKEAGTWRGLRHAKKLPQHGRTKTNSRTLRGNVRKTMGSGRKPPASPT